MVLPVSSRRFSWVDRDLSDFHQIEMYNLRGNFCPYKNFSR